MDDFDGLWYDCENSITNTTDEQVTAAYKKMTLSHIFYQLRSILFGDFNDSVNVKETVQNFLVLQRQSHTQ